MKKERINTLRHLSRRLIRELGILQLSKGQKNPQYWHALIEISKEPEMTIAKLAEALLLSASTTSRFITSLVKQDLVAFKGGSDRREKHLFLTEKGTQDLENIDEFSNDKVKRAFEFLEVDDQKHIISAIQKYGDALEKGRLCRDQVKILTLSTSRTLRKQIIAMVENIQKGEFSLPIREDTNECVLKAEQEFYYNHSYNFWYATDNAGTIIGSIGLKKLDPKTAEIKKFFVDQSYRRKGVAQKLLMALTRAAEKHGFSRLYLGTIDCFQEALRFYEKYGFTQVSQQALPNTFKVNPLDSLFLTAKTEEIRKKLMPNEW